ncbi:hypothetical protein JW948_16345 [bacterium]|nr:hypothetical protein [bacterium]
MEENMKIEAAAVRFATFLTGLCLILVFSQCERFPSNPSLGNSGSPWVEIRHVATEYTANPVTVNGLAADKVNLLTFEILANDFETRALEVFGRVILEGPPYEREHRLHFRTDVLLQKESESCQCLDYIQPELPYQIVRAQFPTNEYSPFMGSQGKVKEVIITDAVAIDANGNMMHIRFKP